MSVGFEAMSASTSELSASDAEMLRKISDVRVKVQSAFGQVVLAMSALPRYRHQSLADLGHLVIDPLVRDRVAMAAPAVSGEAATAASAVATLAFAIWASVSETVSAKIKEQIKAGSFPVRLKPEDWVSGDTVWLLDVVAPSQKQATALLASFRQVAKQDSIFVHPMVARLVDPDVLKKLTAKTDTFAETTDVKRSIVN